MIPGAGIAMGMNTQRSLESLVAGIPGRYIWLRSDAGITDIAGKASVWADRTGNTRSVTQGIDATRPLVVASGGAQDLPYLRFGDTAASYMQFVNAALVGFAAAEMYCVFSRDTDPAVSGNGGLHSIRGVMIGSHIPYINGAVYDAFFTNGRHNAGSILGGATANVGCYSAASAPDGWRNSYNGVELYSNPVNSYTILAAAGIGASQDDVTTYLQGRWYEFLLFSRTLNASQRRVLDLYTRARYGIAP